MDGGFDNADKKLYREVVEIRKGIEMRQYENHRGALSHPLD